MAKLKAPFALDRSLNTTEQTSRNIADVLAEELSAIITALGGLNFINYEVVAELPTTGISTTTIYLVPSDDPQSGNTYDEYINLNGTVSGWEKIGSTAIDLSGYYTSAETDALLDEKVDKDSFDEQTATDEFTTINGGLLSECKVALSPVQDLHGYSEPWVGGASKNIIPMTVDAIKTLNSSMSWVDKVATIYGTTITILTDSADNVIGFDVDGTSSQRIDLHLGTYTANGGNYTISGSTNGSLQKWAVWSRYHGQVESQMSLDGAGTFYDVSGETLMIELTIFQGVTTSHQKFYPMLCLSSAPDPTVFAPYSNICPITGHTESKVGDDGKNRFKVTATTVTEQGVLFNVNSDGTITTARQSTSSNNASIILGDFTLPVGSYKINGANNAGRGGYFTLRKASDNTFIANIESSGYDLNVTDATFEYRLTCVVQSAVSPTGDYVTVKPMIRLSSDTDPTFVPYNGYQVTVNLGGTYYSGILDVVTGVFVPDTADVVYDGSSDENWIKVSGENRYYIEKPSDINANPDGSTSNEFKYSGTSGASVPDGQFYVGGTNLGVRLNTITSVADWKTFLSNNPFMVVYPLATLTPIQLSPTMVKALVGENHLSAPLEGQEITESKYKKMFTFDDVIAYIQSLS